MSVNNKTSSNECTHISNKGEKVLVVLATDTKVLVMLVTRGGDFGGVSDKRRGCWWCQ